MSDKKVILLIEDEPDIAKITSFRLKKAGYDVLHAGDGKQGLEFAKNNNPDMVLLDLGIPIISGSEVCRSIKTDEEIKNIPVVILSASAEGIKEKSEEVHANDFIVKPYEPENLLAKIREFIG